VAVSVAATGVGCGGTNAGAAECPEGRVSTRASRATSKQYPLFADRDAPDRTQAVGDCTRPRTLGAPRSARSLRGVPPDAHAAMRSCSFATPRPSRDSRVRLGREDPAGTPVGEKAPYGKSSEKATVCETSHSGPHGITAGSPGPPRFGLCDRLQDLRTVQRVASHGGGSVRDVERSVTPGWHRRTSKGAPIHVPVPCGDHALLVGQFGRGDGCDHASMMTDQAVLPPRAARPEVLSAAPGNQIVVSRWLLRQRTIPSPPRLYRRRRATNATIASLAARRTTKAIASI